MERIKQECSQLAKEENSQTKLALMLGKVEEIQSYIEILNGLKSKTNSEFLILETPFDGQEENEYHQKLLFMKHKYKILLEDGQRVDYKQIEDYQNLQEEQKILYKKVKDIYKNLIQNNLYLNQKEKNQDENIKIFQAMIDKRGKELEALEQKFLKHLKKTP